MYCIGTFYNDLFKALKMCVQLFERLSFCKAEFNKSSCMVAIVTKLVVYLSLPPLPPLSPPPLSLC